MFQVLKLCCLGPSSWEFECSRVCLLDFLGLGSSAFEGAEQRVSGLGDESGFGDSPTVTLPKIPAQIFKYPAETPVMALVPDLLCRGS